MSSSQRHRPIKRIRLKVTIESDKAVVERLRLEKGAILDDGKLSLTVTARTPEEALEKVEKLGDSIRKASGDLKEFN